MARLEVLVAAGEVRKRKVGFGYNVRMKVGVQVWCLPVILIHTCMVTISLLMQRLRKSRGALCHPGAADPEAPPNPLCKHSGERPMSTPDERQSLAGLEFCQGP